MKSKFLFPNRFKKTGWVVFILGIILGFYYLFFESEPDFLYVQVFSFSHEEFMGETKSMQLIQNNILDELTGLFLIIGALLIAFSKEKSEDEFISKIRLESLVWAVYVNYFILLLAIIFIYDLTFFWVLVFNMFTLLIFFIIRFNWQLSKFKSLSAYEE